MTYRVLHSRISATSADPIGSITDSAGGAAGRYSVVPHADNASRAATSSASYCGPDCLPSRLWRFLVPTTAISRARSSTGPSMSTAGPRARAATTRAPYVRTALQSCAVDQSARKRRRANRPCMSNRGRHRRKRGRVHHSAGTDPARSLELLSELGEVQAGRKRITPPIERLLPSKYRKCGD